MPFSEGTVLQLHSILYRYMPQPGGHWKATNNDLFERHPDGSKRIRFRPVAGHLTPMAMTDTIARYRSALGQHLADPLVLVPLVILDFLCVHPFSDGNGRMARLLTLQLLYHADYTVGRFDSLERIFEESKESYCETLEASSQGWHKGIQNIAPWLDYFWGALLRAYQEFEARVVTIERGRGAKGDRVRAEIRKRNLPFSISEVEEACPGISRNMVRMVLRTMKAEGLIAPTGKGRGARWSALPINKRPAQRITKPELKPNESKSPWTNTSSLREISAPSSLPLRTSPGGYGHHSCPSSIFGCTRAARLQIPNAETQITQLHPRWRKSMRKSEAQTCSELIDQQLAQSHWSVKDPAQVMEKSDNLTALLQGVEQPRTPYEGHHPQSQQEMSCNEQE